MLGALTFFPYPPGLERSPQAYRTLAQTRLTWNPFAIYQPASSSVGMYQMTDAAFAEARHYCIRNHIVVVDGCSLPGSILGHYRAAPSSLRQCFWTVNHGDSRAPATDGGQRTAETGACRNNPSLRRKLGQGVRALRLPFVGWRALRRSGCRDLSSPDQCDDAGVLRIGAVR